jgi:hypothetical protein
VVVEQGKKPLLSSPEGEGKGEERKEDYVVHFFNSNILSLINFSGPDSYRVTLVN